MVTDPHNFRQLVLCVEQSVTSIQLTKYAERRIVSQDMQIVFTIIGESHAVTVLKAGKPVFRELFACVDIPGNAGIISCSLADAQVHENRYYSYKDLYEIHISISDAGPPWQPETAQLLHTFPGSVSPGMGEPYTALKWELTPEKAIWYSIHVYEDKGKLVFIDTRTCIPLISYKGETQ